MTPRATLRELKMVVFKAQGCSGQKMVVVFEDTCGFFFIIQSMSLFNLLNHLVK